MKLALASVAASIVFGVAGGLALASLRQDIPRAWNRFRELWRELNRD